MAHAGIDMVDDWYQRLLISFAEMFRGRIVDAGLATADELDTLVAELADHLATPGTSRRAGADRAGLGPGAGDETTATSSTTRRREAGTRFDGLSAVFDEWTFRHLDAVGLGAGWRAGRSAPAARGRRDGSPAASGPTGKVLATDIDVSWMPGTEAVHRAAATTSPPTRRPPCGFDLVHARLVLTHVPRRAAALRRMAGALRPGGWLVVEDFDVSAQPLACPDAADDDEERANRVRAGFVELLARPLASTSASGARCATACARSGLADVGAEAYAPLALPATRLRWSGPTSPRCATVSWRSASATTSSAHLAALGRRHHRHRHAAAGHGVGSGDEPLEASSWGERTRTPNNRTRICCVANYTTPHGAVRECSGRGSAPGRSDVDRRTR